MRESIEPERAIAEKGPADAILREAWTAAAVGEAERMWDSFESRYISTEHDASTSARNSINGSGPLSLRDRFSSFQRQAVMIAAASLLLVAGWYAGSSRLSSKMATHVSTYTTGDGERASITLPDGSTVLLNVGSKLEVPATFAAGTRSLKLTGEALFTVTHQAGLPFTVLAGTTTTRVLGTTFVVRNYPTDTAAMISVREGRVSVEGEVVNTFEKMIVAHSGERIKATATDAQFSFADNILKIDSVPLGHAIHDLNRWYDVDIQFAQNSSDIRQRQVQGSFAQGTANDLASILSFMFNVHVERQGRTLIIHAK